MILVFVTKNKQVIVAFNLHIYLTDRRYFFTSGGSNQIKSEVIILLLYSYYKYKLL